MKYCIFKNKSYTGLAYNEINQAIKDFHKDDLIVAMEVAPTFKADVAGKVIETLTYSSEEYAKQVLIARNLEIQSELREKFMDAQLKCISDGLVFAEKYPVLSTERTALVAELNKNEATLG